MARYEVFGSYTSNEAKAVRVGWSWGGFLFPEWATLFNRQYLLFFLTLLGVVLLRGLAKAVDDVVFAIVARLIFGLPFGLFLNAFHRHKLAKGGSGWYSKGVFEASGEDVAIYRAAEPVEKIEPTL